MLVLAKKIVFFIRPCLLENEELRVLNLKLDCSELNLRYSSRKKIVTYCLLLRQLTKCSWNFLNTISVVKFSSRWYREMLTMPKVHTSVFFVKILVTLVSGETR